jgi:hypothetical protein
MQPNRGPSVDRVNEIQKIKESDVRFIIRTIAAGAVSVAARIIIKKIQDRNKPDSAA